MEEGVDDELRTISANATTTIPYHFNDYYPIISHPNPDEPNEIVFDATEWEIIDPRTGKKRFPRQNEFLELLLINPRYRSYICWIDRDQGLCRILLPNHVATLWGRVKHRHTNRTMTYQTFSRGLRYHYTNGSLIKTKRKHTFCLRRTALSLERIA